MTAADLHGMTGAYALHALPDGERAAFERHLPDCEPCAQETAELCATTARLGLAVSVIPGPALRERVLSRITTVRQEAPGGPVPGLPGRFAARRTLPWSRWALAACLAAVAALGGTTVWQHERAEDALGRAQRAERGAAEVAAVLAAPDARAATGAFPGGATGTVVVSRGRDKAVLVVSGMARPPAGKVYQLWFDDGGTMRSAGLMDPGRRSQSVLLRGAVAGASGMGVSVEPAGGSEQPTAAPVALLGFTT
ncbi:anti-sigma factor [Streptomyces qinzhouensis]|uniref:Regulator of SigK n=1 Tax=Streptomyces qinzhouensis TaxID=2599401 RepID=A0A5B8J5F7_9ACTN|nr:anti-sigma factor [Streptomyces qinzhouensis]QDY75634.1 anti-sigma factor [Streptomyces qinzhouensis]